MLPIFVLGAEAPSASSLPDPNSLGLIELPLAQWPANGVLEIPWDGRLVAAANLNTAPKQYVFGWEMVQNGQHLRLNLRTSDAKPPASVLTLELQTQPGQMADGRIQFPISASQPETLEGASKGWSWEFTPTRTGAYTVEVTAACPKYTGEVVEFGTKKDLAMGMVNGTGSKARFIQSSIGRFVVTDSQPQRLYLRHGEGERVKSTLLSVTLRPTSESGRIVSQDSLGNVVLPAADVILNGTHSTLDAGSKSFVRWANESDALAWEFNARQPGRFTADLSFQPGTLPGGTELELTLGGNTSLLHADSSQTTASLSCDVLIPAAGEQRISLRFHHKIGTQPVEIRDIRLSPKIADFAIKSDQ